MLTAIETEYKGYRFRSRLEARWAVFFDKLDIAWEYEKEGYDLGETGWYLPDFWLPFYGNDRRGYPQHRNSGYWVEIKGAEPTQTEQNKVLALAKQGPHVIWLFIGDPGLCQIWTAHPKRVQETGFSKHIWQQKKGSGFRSADYIIPLWSTFDRLRPNMSGDKACVQSIVDAIIAARSARFEHGEHGTR